MNIRARNILEHISSLRNGMVVLPPSSRIRVVRTTNELSRGGIQEEIRKESVPVLFVDRLAKRKDHFISR